MLLLFALGSLLICTSPNNSIIGGRDILPKIQHIADDAKQNVVSIERFSRELLNDHPQESYARRQYEFKLALHWGQLKLMLSEIEFLSLVLLEYDKDKINKPIYMVYAGAAPGHHIVYMQKLFPSVHFELYDPREFAIKTSPNINIHNQLFLETDARYWADQTDKCVVLCSDIRTEPATEERVKIDMDMQLEWWKTIKPFLTMFKFRLPWHEGITLYPAGNIYWQAFPGPTSTETRLIFKGDAAMTEYDNKKYETQCFYHNNKCRKLYYDCILGHLDLKKDGVDNCYDCVSLINIVQTYLKSIKFESDDDGLKTKIRQLIKDIQKHCMFGKYNIYTKTLASFKDLQGNLEKLNNQ